MKPSDWCQMMIDNAEDGETAYDYFVLKDMWEKRGL